MSNTVSVICSRLSFVMILERKQMGNKVGNCEQNVAMHLPSEEPHLFHIIRNCFPLDLKHDLLAI